MYMYVSVLQHVRRASYGMQLIAVVDISVCLFVCLSVCHTLMLF